MPRGPEPVHLETPEGVDEATKREYRVRIHTALGPGGERRTINRSAIIAANNPGTAAATVVAHVENDMEAEGTTPDSGTSYYTHVEDTETKQVWTMSVEVGERTPGKSPERQQSTYRQRAADEPDTESDADATARSEKSQGTGRRVSRFKVRAVDPENAHDEADQATGLHEYYVRVLSQQSEKSDAMPLDADGTVVSGNAIDAAELGVEDFRARMPGLIPARNRRTTYQVHVVQTPNGEASYDGWHIEVTYDTKAGFIGKRRIPTSATVH